MNPKSCPICNIELKMYGQCSDKWWAHPSGDERWGEASDKPCFLASVVVNECDIEAWNIRASLCIPVNERCIKKLKIKIKKLKAKNKELKRHHPLYQLIARGPGYIRRDVLGFRK